jgi:hypothetical protein
MGKYKYILNTIKNGDKKMTKSLKTIKASMIMGVIIVSLFVAMVPTISAQGLGIFSFRPVLSINIDNPEDTSGIIPADPDGKVVRVTVLYQINGLLAQIAAPRLNNAGDAHISVTLGEYPDYCNIYLLTQDLFIDISHEQTPSDYPIQLRITFLENAPLLAVVNVPLILKAEVQPAFPYRVEDIEVTKTISVSAAYVPIIDAVPQQTQREVAPGDIAEFKIDLENKGNAETQFVFDLSEVPEGWTASIISQAKISSAAVGGNAKKTVSLQVRPPYQFGYHDEEKQITVTVTGYYYADASGTNTSSRPIDIRVLVRNRGFSFQPGWEMAVIVVVIIALILLFLMRKTIFKK